MSDCTFTQDAQSCGQERLAEGLPLRHSIVFETGIDQIFAVPIRDHQSLPKRHKRDAEPLMTHIPSNEINCALATSCESRTDHIVFVFAWLFEEYPLSVRSY